MFSFPQIKKEIQFQFIHKVFWFEYIYKMVLNLNLWWTTAGSGLVKRKQNYKGMSIDFHCQGWYTWPWHSSGDNSRAGSYTATCVQLNQETVLLLWFKAIMRETDACGSTHNSITAGWWCLSCSQAVQWSKCQSHHPLPSTVSTQQLTIGLL